MPQRMLDVHGPDAQQLATLWWVLLALAILVSIAFIALTLVAIARARRRATGEPVREIDARAFVWGGGVIVPVILLSVSLVYSYVVSRAMRPPWAADAEPLTVEVTGHMFWWEVRYPQYGVHTANEFHIPTGEPVRLLIRASDVIHSFWVPQLHGKIDMIPGRLHTWWLRADSPGVFRGQCAEYCGMGHALMALWLTAAPRAEFDAWIARRQLPRTAPAAEPAEPSVEAGRHVFKAAGCAQCHATREAPLPEALASVAPVLSDFGERRSIAAARMPNSPANLAAWITNPEALKPGSRMPPTRLDSASMNALIAYLYSQR